MYIIYIYCLFAAAAIAPDYVVALDRVCREEIVKNGCECNPLEAPECEEFCCIYAYDIGCTYDTFHKVCTYVPYYWSTGVETTTDSDGVFYASAGTPKTYETEIFNKPQSPTQDNDLLLKHNALSDASDHVDSDDDDDVPSCSKAWESCVVRVCTLFGDNVRKVRDACKENCCPNENCEYDSKGTLCTATMSPTNLPHTCPFYSKST